MSIVYEYIDYKEFIKNAKENIKVRRPIRYYITHYPDPIGMKLTSRAYITAITEDDHILVTSVSLKSKWEEGDFREWANELIRKHEEEILNRLKRDIGANNISYGVYCDELSKIKEFKVLERGG